MGISIKYKFIILKSNASHIKSFDMILSKVLRHTFSYEVSHAVSIKDPIYYWKRAAERIQWHQFPKTILRVDDLHFYKWFPDGKLNISVQCIDRHLKDRPAEIAYHYQSPITQQRSQITYAEFHKRVENFAGGLRKEFKVQPGDRVIIYMPMTIQSLVAIHACARIGATHVIVFGGFSAHELANRIQDCDPKLVICATAGKEPTRVINYKKIIDESLNICKHNLPKIVYQRTNLIDVELGENDHDFMQVENSGSKSGPIILDSSHPLYILYTSGTTGKPKGILRDHGGTAVALQHWMYRVYKAAPGDSMFCSSDIGWVLGHSYIIYGPMIAGMRSVVFEGKPVGTPSPDVFWEIIDRLKIDHLYTSPTAIRTIRKEDSEGLYINRHDLKHLKSITLVGERCDVPTFKWVQDHLKDKFVNDTYWQTETGGPILSNYLGFSPFPQKPGSACKPVPGFNVKIINSQTGAQCKENQVGTVYVKQPLPPSFMQTILNNDDIYIQKYFESMPGYYNTGDSGFKDEDGYFHVMSREDDVINTAGHRLSTGEMEEILMKHPKIAEAIVIGATDEIKGQIPTAFVTIKTEYLQNYDSKTIAKDTIALIREHIGPVASFKHCFVVSRLPKTRSGKYLRHIVRKIFNKQKYEVPSTIEDMEVVFELENQIENIHKDW